MKTASAGQAAEKARAGPATDEGSKLEQEYYTAFIWPKELAGEIDHVERHVRFELLPKAEYCGVSLPAAHYTPDFLIYYKSGDVEAVEVKHEAIRKTRGIIFTGAACSSTI